MFHIAIAPERKDVTIDLPSDTKIPSISWNVAGDHNKTSSNRKTAMAAHSNFSEFQFDDRDEKHDSLHRFTLLSYHQASSKC
jgi:hypothetical protein